MHLPLMAAIVGRSRLSRALRGLASIVALAVPTALAAQAPVQNRKVSYVLRFTPNTPVDAVGLPEVLRAPVTLHLHNVPVAEALDAIGRQAESSFWYTTLVVPRKEHVSLDITGATVAEALRQALQGLRVEVWVSTDRRMAIVPAAAFAGEGARQSGNLIGRVTERATETAIASAQVTVAGTGLSRYTDDKGQYRITGVPIGEHEITVRRLGFEVASRKVRIADRETATMDFVMGRVATALTEVVTTATGERSRVEVGNAIGTIKADSVVATTLIRNMSDLLTARTPGVVVTNSAGMVGAPSTIRIRGLASVSLSNDPIIILDGIRLTPPSNAGAATSIGDNRQAFPSVNGANFLTSVDNAPSRIDDIDPNIIESIDVLRGPSASSLYGTDAAAGVIVIRTRKGVAGPWHLGILADDGTSHVPGTFPAYWVAYGHLPNGTPITNCFGYAPLFSNVLQNTCVQDSVRSYPSPLDNPRLTTLGTGGARNLSANLSGGTEQLREFLSLRLSDALGLVKLSDVEQDRIARMWGETPPPWMQHPNTEQNINGSSRTSLRINRDLDMSLTANGVYRSTLLGTMGTYSDWGGVYPSGGLARGFYDTLIYLPAEFMRARSQGVTKRGYGAATANYTPLSWLVFRGTLGGDYTLRTDDGLGRGSDCTAVLFPSGCPSTHVNSRGETFVTTFDLGAQVTWAPRSWLTLRSSLGEQYSHTTFYNLTAQSCFTCSLAFGTDLLTPSPITTTSGAQLFSVTENRDESATAGGYLEETANFRERLFLTAAFREDVSSAFGRNVNAKAPVYPKYSLSWLISDESFFPKTSWVSSLRLRTAYGHSGQEARQTAVLNNFAVVNVDPDGTVVPGIIIKGIGNPDLRPERTAELEGGFDLSLLDHERIHVEGTVYRKLSNDAIASRTFSYAMGSAGGAGNPTRNTENFNLGRVENRGWELATTLKLMDTRTVAWELTVNATRNVNRLVSSTTATIPINGSIGNFVGYPLQSWFNNRINGYADLNGDGILEQNEVQVGTQAVFVGTSTPESELTYLSGLSLWGGMFQVNATIDQINGWTRDLSLVTSVTGSFALRAAQVTPPASLAEQAAVLNSLINSANWRYKSNTVRLAELSATWNAPKRMASQWLHAHTAAITLAARNLALWTTYAGKDPDVALNSGTGSLARDAQANDAVLPQPRTWTFRINLGY